MYIRLIVSFIFILVAFFLFSGSTFATYQQQGFANFQEQGTIINAQCDKQCFLLIGKKLTDNYIKISGIKGIGSLSLGALGQNGQILSLSNKIIKNNQETYNLIIPSNLNQEAELVIVFNGNIIVQNSNIIIGRLGFFDGIYQGIIDALEYKEYNPRTINFLEGPMWRGKYINEYFFWKITIVLLIISFFYLLTNNKNDKKQFIKAGLMVIVFFWVLFDLFSTINQFKMFNKITGENQIMNNGRIGTSSDYYQFLEFIKSQDIKGKKGYFIAPYPLHFEGRYHIYPYLGVGSLTGSEILIYYNSLGPAAQSFGFKEPIVENNQISFENSTITFEKVVEWKPYAKIYFIK